MAIHLDDEPRLVAEARDGNQEAFRILVNQYYRNIYNLVLKIARNHEDTEDALQWAFLKAYCNLNQFQGNSRIYTWFVRIAVNEALMRLRKKRGERELPLEEATQAETPSFSHFTTHWSDNPEQRYAQVEAQEILDRALGSLSPRLCRAFLLRNVDELSMRETAEALGLSISAVKSRLVRARSRLRLRLRTAFPAEFPSRVRSNTIQ